MDTYFLWETHDCYKGNEPCYGPYYSSHKTALGRTGFVFALNELLKIPNLSETLKKRLRGARSGTAVKIHAYARNSNLFVRRLTDEEVKEWQEYHVLKKRELQIAETINDAIPALIEKQKKVRSRLKKIKKVWHTIKDEE